MPSPEIVNRLPQEGDTDVAVDALVSLSLRDADSAVMSSSVYVAMLYAPTTFRAEYLPDVDPLLGAEGVEHALICFNDAVYSPPPRSPCATALVSVMGGTAYRITRGSGAGEGFLYITAPVVEGVPVGASVRLTVDTVIPFGGYPEAGYAPWTDYTGVMLGFFYGPRNTAIFLFFRNNAGTYSITVTGPALDVGGTRTEFTTQVFDWTADSYTYRILWDETSGRRTFLVSAISSVGVETLLYTGSILAVPSFLPDTRVGSDSGTSSRAGVIVGTDGPEADSVDVYNAALFTFGKTVVSAGLPTVGSLSAVASDASTVDVGNWEAVGTGTFSEGTFTRTDTDAVDSFYRTREEPALVHQEWVVYAGIQGETTAHAGTYDTGMGLQISDGSVRMSVRLYDDYETKTLGFLHGSSDLETDYTFPSTAVDWETAQDVVLTGSISRNLVRMWVGGELATSYAYTGPGYPAETSRRVTVGFLTDSLGALTLRYLWVLPIAWSYEAADASYPEAQGGSRNSGGVITRSVASSLLTLDARGGGYDYYAFAPSSFDNLTGTVAVWEGSVPAWTSRGATNPRSVGLGPVMQATYTAYLGAGLYFVEAEDGQQYVYIATSDEEGTLTEVLRQSAAGRALSFALTFTETHTYLLQVQPLHYIRLYVDFVLAIEIPWSTTGGFDLPEMVAGETYALFGVPPGVSMTVANFRAAYGHGLDLQVGVDMTEAEREAYAFNSDVEVFLDLEDT